MGSVTFGIPLDLAERLVAAADLSCAVETGTYLGGSALALAELVDEVWSVELKPEILAQARSRIGDRPEIHLLEGYSPEVLPGVLQQVPGPALFWLDGHGGTFGANDVDVPECPVLDELAAIAAFPYAAASVVLIDDARAFFGPLLHHRAEEWPTFLEVAAALGDRYVTVLDDVVIGVPWALRPVVDDWWRSKLSERDGLEAHAYLIGKLMDPEWAADFKAAWS
jgi:hypothetical protein